MSEGNLPTVNESKGITERRTFNEWGQMREQANSLIRSGFLPPAIRTPEQAMAIGMMGKELGLGLMASLKGIDVIQQKPVPKPLLHLALAMRTGNLENQAVVEGADFVTYKVKRKGMEWIESTFGIKNAKQMGIAGKDAYNKNPLDMFLHRAMGRALNIAFPEVVFGLARYSEEVADMFVDDSPVDAPPQPNDAPVSYTEPEVVEESPESKMVEDIIAKLGALNGGLEDGMEAHLKTLTTWKSKDTGEEKFLTLKDLPSIAKRKPAWLKGIHKKVVEEHERAFGKPESRS